jgi:hypothetical protein
MHQGLPAPPTPLLPRHHRFRSMWSTVPFHVVPLFRWMWAAIPLDVGRNSGKWSTIPVKTKMRTASQRNHGPLQTESWTASRGITGPLRPESAEIPAPRDYGQEEYPFQELFSAFRWPLAVSVRFLLPSAQLILIPEWNASSAEPGSIISSSAPSCPLCELWRAR